MFFEQDESRRHRIGYFSAISLNGSDQETTCIEVQGAPALGLKLKWSEGKVVILHYG